LYQCLDLLKIQLLFHRNVCRIVILIFVESIKNITPNHAFVSCANSTNQVSKHDSFHILGQVTREPNEEKKTMANENKTLEI